MVVKLLRHRVLSLVALLRASLFRFMAPNTYTLMSLLICMAPYSEASLIKMQAVLNSSIQLFHDETGPQHARDGKQWQPQPHSFSLVSSPFIIHHFAQSLPHHFQDFFFPIQPAPAIPVVLSRRHLHMQRVNQHLQAGSSRESSCPLLLNGRVIIFHQSAGVDFSSNLIETCNNLSLFSVALCQGRRIIREKSFIVPGKLPL